MNAQALAKKVVALQSAINAMKPFYEALDKMTMELREAMEKEGLSEVEVEEQSIPFNGSMLFMPKSFVRVKDNFLEKNTVFRSAGVKRFEADIEGFEERLVKMEKLAKKAKNA